MNQIISDTSEINKASVCTLTIDALTYLFQ